MDYNYSRRNIPAGENTLERVFEILPGTLSWSIIIGMLILSIARPFAAASIMIAFILYWVMRLL